MKSFLSMSSDEEDRLINETYQQLAAEKPANPQCKDDGEKYQKISELIIIPGGKDVSGYILFFDRG
jgi:hypothetical protein